MNHGVTLAVTVAGAVLFAAPSAAADASPPPATPLTTTPPPAAYPPGASPAPVPYYGPGVYPGPPAGGYYAPPPGAYYDPPGAYPPPPPMERRSVGAMVGGIVAVSGGFILAMSALVVSVAAETCGIDAIGTSNTCPDRTATEIGLSIGSIAAIAVGIPLIIYGAKKVPVGGAPIAGALPGMPAWAGAPGGTGWRWRF